MDTKLNDPSKNLDNVPQDKQQHIMIMLQVKTCEYYLFHNTLHVSPHESLISHFTNLS